MLFAIEDELDVLDVERIGPGQIEIMVQVRRSFDAQQATQESACLRRDPALERQFHRCGEDAWEAVAEVSALAFGERRGPG